MGLIYEVCHGGVRHWLYQGDGIDLRGRVMGAADWNRGDEIDLWGACHGDTRHWLDRGDGIDSWGHVTLAGSERWNCFMRTRDTGWSGAMGLIYGGVWHWLEQGDGIDGIDSRGLALGAHDIGWIRVMGLIYGGGACNTGWIRAMGLIDGDTSGRWD